VRRTISQCAARRAPVTQYSHFNVAAPSLCRGGVPAVGLLPCSGGPDESGQAVLAVPFCEMACERARRNLSGSFQSGVVPKPRRLLETGRVCPAGGGMRKGTT